jgi:hypothetical protein
VPLPFTPGNSILKSLNALPLRRTTRYSFLPFTPGICLLSHGFIYQLFVGSCYHVVSSGPRGSSSTPQFIFTWLVDRPLDWTPTDYQFIQFFVSRGLNPTDSCYHSRVASCQIRLPRTIRSYHSSGCTAVHSRGPCHLLQLPRTLCCLSTGSAQPYCRSLVFIHMAIVHSNWTPQTLDSISFSTMLMRLWHSCALPWFVLLKFSCGVHCSYLLLYQHHRTWTLRCFCALDHSSC